MAADLLRRHRMSGQELTRRAQAARDSIRAAAVVLPALATSNPVRQAWQREAWHFYHSLGTFRFAMDWHSQTVSRVRLTAATISPGGSEPAVITTGPAADIMRDFFGGTSGQTRYMTRMDVLTQVAGEGYVVAYDEPLPGSLTGETQRCWRAVSARQLQARNGLWRVEVEQGLWLDLPEDNTLVFRQWNEDAELSYLADAPTRAALTDMRTIDLLQKRVVAQTVSRLASNGMLLYPAEITFPAKPKYKDQPDPFLAELLDIATKGIQDPGAASAAIPLPIKVPSELIEKWRHLDFSNAFDEHMLKYLEFLYDRLATGMNMPKEVVSGMGSTSHWNAWTLDEQAVEIHIKPPVEALCAGLTTAYLQPALLAAGESTVTTSGDQIIVWYDTSQLDVPSDRSSAADAAFDRMQISEASYRREKGFSEDDAPDKQDLLKQLLLKWAQLDPQNAFSTVIQELTGDKITLPAPPAPPAAGAAPTGPGENGGTTPAQPAPAAGPKQPSPPQDSGPPPSS